MTNNPIGGWMEEDIIEEVYTDEDEYFEAVDYLQEHGLYEENYHE